MTKQESLNKAAQEFGYESLDDVEFSDCEPVFLRAMDIYAGEQEKENISVNDEKVKYYEDKIEMMIRTSAEIEKEAYNQAIRDAAESAELAQECGEYKPYCNQRNCDNCHKIISKQSILKLLK